MYLISHRGNLDGPNPQFENDPLYLAIAVSKGFKVEVDLWFKDKNYWLGHDKPQYRISMEWLKDNQEHLFIHCKNIKSLEKISNSNLHYFWHEEDNVTLTSKGFIWAHPKIKPPTNSISVLPERHNWDLEKCKGICSDYIIKYK
jgi:hypothetical protein